jgi:DNA uptake protein ComE-like DNA-binding protein
MPGIDRGIWNLSQRRAIIAILSILILIVAIILLRNPRQVPNVQPTDAPLANRLADRIDPNTADADVIAEIPELGEARAQEIVTYREQFAAAHPGKPAFISATDLLHIKGIGIATMEMMEPYLIFPTPTKLESTTKRGGK